VARSWAEIEDADALVFLHDLTRLGDARYEQGDAEIAARLPARLLADERVLHVFNKLDLQRSASAHEGIVISAVTGEGLDALRDRLLALAGWQAAPEGQFIARARHVHALQRAREHLGRAADHAQLGNAALELFAEELRLAHDALGEITGAFSADDLLGAIFARFCIGK
jgi:tRNA modification GTPase